METTQNNYTESNSAEEKWTTLRIKLIKAGAETIGLKKSSWKATMDEVLQLIDIKTKPPRTIKTESNNSSRVIKMLEISRKCMKAMEE